MSGLGLLFSRRGIMSHPAEGEPPEIDNNLVPLYLEALENMEVTFSVNAIQYSLDNNTWNDLPAGTPTPIVPAGNKVFFRASGLSPVSSKGIGTFSATGRFNTGGNAMSLINGENFLDIEPAVASYQFHSLFKSSSVVNAQNLILPAMTMQQSCYASIFYECNELLTAPELPADTLAKSCYHSAFYNCANLIKGPSVLPAPSILGYSYMKMFYGNKQLEVAPDILAISITGSFYENEGIFQNCSKLRYIKAMIKTNPTNFFFNWVKGVAAEGVFVKNVAATWNVVGTSGVPSGWTIEYAES